MRSTIPTTLGYVKVNVTELVLTGVKPADLLTHNLEADALPLQHNALVCALNPKMLYRSLG